MLTPTGTSEFARSDRLATTVLLVEDTHEEADRASQVLASRVPNVQVIHARSLSAAHSCMVGATLDLIVTRHPLAEGSCADVLELAASGEEAIPVVAYVLGSEDEAQSVRQQYPTLLDCQACRADGGHLLRLAAHYLLAVARVKRAASAVPDGAPRDLIRRVRHTISRVNHDLNNPLSIISGNAQLLVELSRMMDLDDDLCVAIHDIEEASSRVQGILRRLLDLRDQLPGDGDAAVDLREELRELQHERT